LGRVLGLNPIPILTVVYNKKIKNTCQVLDDIFFARGVRYPMSFLEKPNKLKIQYGKF
jgi:hypothetical protein